MSRYDTFRRFRAKKITFAIFCWPLALAKMEVQREAPMKDVLYVDVSGL